jgi:hypothetical protein
MWHSCRDGIAVIHYDSMWRAAHRHAKWAELAELALPFVSCTTSESDAERILSMQKKKKNVARLHETRFTISGMMDRLRSHTLSQEFIRSDLVPRFGGHFDPGDDKENGDP